MKHTNGVPRALGSALSDTRAMLGAARRGAWTEVVERHPGRDRRLRDGLAAMNDATDRRRVQRVLELIAGANRRLTELGAAGRDDTRERLARARVSTRAVRAYQRAG